MPTDTNTPGIMQDRKGATVTDGSQRTAGKSSTSHSLLYSLEIPCHLRSFPHSRPKF